MFDAKVLLDALMRGHQRSDQSGAGPANDPTTGGSLQDILSNLQRQLGQPSSDASLRQEMSGGGLTPPGHDVRQSPTGSSGGGGLGDILGQLQRQLNPSGQPGSTGPGAGGPAGGNILDTLGQVFGQATTGVREGAGRLDEMTGASDRTRDILGQLTGKTPEQLMAQLQELIKHNQLGTGAALGGLGALILGTQTGRSLATGAAKLGALALIGGLAYQAYRNYSEGRSPLDGGQTTAGLLEQPAPTGSGFEPEALTNETAVLCLRAMVAAAAADGRIDPAEQQKILGGLENAGLDQSAEAFLRQEIERPATAEQLAAEVTSQQQAVQVLTAARLTVDLDSAGEHQFLTELADRLGLESDLTAHIDATARAVAA